MKTKLLRRLHKRFIWYYDTQNHIEWQVYDKVTEKTVWTKPYVGYYLTERAVYAMLSILGLSRLWVSRRNRCENVRRFKRDTETKNRFYSRVSLIPLILLSSLLAMGCKHELTCYDQRDKDAGIVYKKIESLQSEFLSALNSNQNTDSLKRIVVKQEMLFQIKKQIEE